MVHWEQLRQDGQEIPGSRSSHCMAATSSAVYLFGGELQPRVPVPADTFTYDLQSGAWSKLKTTGVCSGPRVAATMAAVGDNIYLFGGRTGVDMGEGAQSDLFILDTSSNQWSPVQLAPGSPSPPPRSYHAMTAAAGKMYVFGGCGAAGRLADLWCFNPDSSSWVQLPSCEAVGARGGSVLVAATDGSKLFVMGGFNGAEMADCHSFDLATSTWSCPACCDNNTAAANAAAASDSDSQQQSKLMVMPLARSVFGAAVHGSCGSTNACAAAGASSSCSHDGHIVTFGGEVAPSDKGHAGAGNFTAATFCMCPPSSACGAAGHTRHHSGDHTGSQAAATAAAAAHSTWHALEVGGDAPGPRDWFAAAVLPGGDLLVHGGLGADNERLADMYRLHMH